MKLAAVLAAIVVALSVPSLQAQGRGNGQAKKTTVSTPKAKTQTQAPKSTAKQAAKVDTRAAKTTAKADARAAKTTAKADTRAAKADAKTARKSSTLTIVETNPTATTPTTHSVKNPKLEARLLTLLPPGTVIQDAAMGFKNWGQFVAATHVSTNLGIPFADLKARMTGIPIGSTVPTMAPMSLGQAIQSFKVTPPTTPPTTTTTTTTTVTGTETATWTPTKIRNEVKKAEDAANTDLRRSRESS
jgi:hypothetical protein